MLSPRRECAAIPRGVRGGALEKLSFFYVVDSTEFLRYPKAWEIGQNAGNRYNGSIIALLCARAGPVSWPSCRVRGPQVP
jgi:hypothetical protein